MEVYNDALTRILVGGKENSMVLLGKTWERRELFNPDDNIYQMILGAGVGLLAHMDMGIEMSAPFIPREEDGIITAVESYSGDLSPPAKALYDHLMDEDSDVTPTDLRNDVQHLANVNSVKARVQRLEAHAYADLLFLLTEDSIEDLPPIEVYGKALREASDETPDSEETKVLLQMAWDQRHDHELETESYATTMEAGVGLAAYLKLFETTPEYQAQEDILNEVADHTDALSPAAKAVFDQLTKNKSTVTPRQLRTLVDKSVEEPTVTELEALVYADLLEKLRDT